MVHEEGGIIRSADLVDGCDDWAESQIATDLSEILGREFLHEFEFKYRV